MLSLIGSVVGFGASFAPKILDYFQDRADKKHELAVMERQAEIKLDQTAIEANIREIESLHEHDARMSGGKFIDGLRSSVRPVITYLFMGLFMTAEITAYLILIDSGINAADAVQLIFDDEIMAIWASILAFWFGSRSIKR
tara:strand:- start:22721 stop:23143 length:423 start_codon:yes stop_codon:yes gene_type:complete